MNIAGLAIDRRALPVQLTRQGAGDYNEDGDFVVGVPAVLTIPAVVQPASGRQMMDVPEGIRNEARWLLWSRSEVRNDDVLAVSGKSYRVVYLWPRADGDFYRAAMGEVVS